MQHASRHSRLSTFSTDHISAAQSGTGCQRICANCANLVHLGAAMNIPDAAFEVIGQERGHHEESCTTFQGVKVHCLNGNHTEAFAVCWIDHLLWGILARLITKHFRADKPTGNGGLHDQTSLASSMPEGYSCKLHSLYLWHRNRG